MSNTKNIIAKQFTVCNLLSKLIGLQFSVNSLSLFSLGISVITPRFNETDSSQFCIPSTNTSNKKKKILPLAHHYHEICYFLIS